MALVVANPVGEILVLQEFVNKPHLGKHAGMWSIPMETRESEDDYHSTLRKLHEQELAALPSVQFPVRHIGAYQVVPRAWVKLYATTSSTYHLPALAHDQSEVGNHRWVTLQEACGLWLRRGALEMIRDYAGGMENVLRRECSQPQLVRA